MSLLLGLDIGTSSIKAVCFDPQDGRVVAMAALPTPVNHPQPGHSEHDPQDLWLAVAACIREACARSQDHGEVGGLAVAGFAEAGVPLDRHAVPIYPAIAWYDRRTEPQAAWWGARFPAEVLHATTGQTVSPSFGVTKWLWVRDHVPRAARRLAAWLSVPDYVLWRLTGERITDYSLASRTLLFDQRACDWSEPLLAAASLRRDQLPRLAAGGTFAGTVTTAAAAEIGVPEGTPCAVGGHDHLVAALAAGCLEPGVVVDSGGTAQALLMVVPEFQTMPAMAASGFACYHHAVPDRYVLKAGLKAYGGAIEWLSTLLSSNQEHPSGGLPYDELEQLAEPGVGRTAGPIWLPHLIGSGTPEGDRRSRAALVGARVEHSRGDLFRGLLESLAFWLRDNLEAMAALAGPPQGALTLLGGTGRLHLLNRLKADVLDRSVRVPDLPAATAVGAALLAGVGAGVFADPAAAAGSLRYSATVLHPDPANVAWYREIYEQAYRPLYRALRDVNHVLEALDSSSMPRER